MTQDVDHLFEQAQQLKDSGQPDRAVDIFRQAIEQYEAAGNVARVALCHEMIGVCFKIANDIPQAVQSLQQAADEFGLLGDTVGVGNCFRDTGIAYSYDHQYDQALEWFHKSLELLAHSDDILGWGITQAKIGLTHLYKQEFPEAKRWLNDGLSTVRTALPGAGSSFMEMTICLHLAELSCAQQDFQTMITRLWAALGLIYDARQEESQSRRLSEIYGLLAHGYALSGNAEHASKLLEQSLALLQQMPETVRPHVVEDTHMQQTIDQLKMSDAVVVEELTRKIDFEAFGLRVAD